MKPYVKCVIAQGKAKSFGSRIAAISVQFSEYSHLGDCI